MKDILSAPSVGGRSWATRMKVLGITGGVGAGKSTVLAYMKEKYGAYLLECDTIGRCLQQKGEACFKPIVDLFGEECLGEDGELDRGKIAAIVFSDASDKNVELGKADEDMQKIAGHLIGIDG